MREPSELAQHIIDFAVEMAGWSPCRSKRGVVIFDGENIIAHGYNYKPRPFECDGSAECKATCRRAAVHAEQQALLSASTRASGLEMVHVKADAGHLVESGGPSCVECSKLILAAGIAGVWLYHATGWRRYPAQEFHQLSLEAFTLGQQQAPQELQHELNAWRELGEEMGRIVSFMSKEQAEDLLPDWFGPRLFDLQVKARVIGVDWASGKDYSARPNGAQEPKKDGPCSAAAQLDHRHLANVLCWVSQIFNGWRPCEEWSQWDEEVAQAVVAIQRQLDVEQSGNAPKEWV